VSGFDYITRVLDSAIEEVSPVRTRGKVLRVSGNIVKAMVPAVSIGEICMLTNPWNNKTLQAEVVGFSGQAALLSPLGPLIGISSSTEVHSTGQVLTVPVGKGLLGRVMDGLGRPMDEDEKGELVFEDHYPIYSQPPPPLERTIISRPLPLGIKVFDGVLTCGEGQRIGIFAAAGGGKSTLLACLVKGAEVDVTVLALVGERGREVREFIEQDLGPEGMKKTVVVVSTSDKSAMERLKAAYTATAIAEYFRDSGKRVLLLMDSVTRFARAQREIGLAAGEPPTRRGFPPSVFSALPELMERAGTSALGSITALYTILVEGDDMTEPVADETRSILDGHIVLSRKLAEANHYPAIDVLASISRVMSSVVEAEHRRAAAKLREIVAKYQEVELLIRLGEYKKGTDAAVDEAVSKIDAVNEFLRQGTDEVYSFDETVSRLIEVVS
jgi:ATP synthase in type III secretion protein N